MSFGAVNRQAGFAKSDRDNIDDEEVEDLRQQGRAWLGLGDARMKAALADEELQEVTYGEDE